MNEYEHNYEEKNKKLPVFGSFLFLGVMICN